jgi:hypothetical protein
MAGGSVGVDLEEDGVGVAVEPALHHLQVIA